MLSEGFQIELDQLFESHSSLPMFAQRKPPMAVYNAGTKKRPDQACQRVFKRWHANNNSSFSLPMPSCL
jgi:hypothetical protein